MISNYKQIEELFKEIDEKLKRKVELYLIGGAALLYKGLRGSTKDIDLVSRNFEEKISFEKALRSLGFEGKKITNKYRNLEVTNILSRKDFRIDLFMKKVCSTLSLSEGVEKRANQIFFGENLSVFACSNEDILLFKAIARRDADIDDCIALSKQSPDWGLIITEIKEQIKQGKEIWITYLAEGLEKIQGSGIEIPIMKEVIASYEDYMNKLSHEKDKSGA